MNKLIYILVIFALLCSCNHQNDIKQTIARADSLMDTNQDSARVALAILDSLGAKKPKMSKAQRMHNELIYAKGMNKGFVVFKTDSIMKQVVDYYTSHGSANDKMLANYLLGCVYRDLEDSPASLDWYHRAAECADTARTDCNYELLAIIYGQIGSIFLSQEMPQNALQALEKTKEYAKISKDTVLLLQALSNQSHAYLKMENKAKYIQMKEYLFHQYSMLGMHQDAALELCTTICEYVNSSNLLKAKQLMDLYEKPSGLIDSLGNVAKGKVKYYFTKGNYYLKSNQVKLAIKEYYKLLHESQAVDEREMAYRGLLKAYQMQHNSDSIGKYGYLATEANDSVFRKMQTKTLLKMQAQYNYDQMERKAEKLAVINKYIVYIGGGVLMIILLSCLVIVFFLRQRNTKRALQFKQLQVQAMQYLQDNKKILKAKQHLDAILSNEKNSHNETIREYEKKIEILNKRISEFEKPIPFKKCNEVNVYLRSIALRKIIDKKALLGQKITKEELIEIGKILGEQTPKFYALVFSLDILNETDIAVCLLVRLFFSSSDIHVLLGISSGHASTIKRRIALKLFGEELSPKEFEEKLHNLV